MFIGGIFLTKTDLGNKKKKKNWILKEDQTKLTDANSLFKNIYNNEVQEVTRGNLSKFSEYYQDFKFIDS